MNKLIPLLLALPLAACSPQEADRIEAVLTGKPTPAQLAAEASVPVVPVVEEINPKAPETLAETVVSPSEEITPPEPEPEPEEPAAEPEPVTPPAPVCVPRFRQPCPEV